MNTTILSKREEVLSKVKDLRTSTSINTHELNSLQLEKDLSDLHVTLPMKKLTKALLAAGGTFVGFLYNTGFSAYVYADSNEKWLYAGKTTTEGAVRFSAYQDSVGNIVLTAKIGLGKAYFNWRTSTGACKLYDSYDKLDAKDWAETKFKIFNPNNEQYVGTWSNTDESLYQRKNVVRTQFEFNFFDEDEFSKDDKLIYSAYMKNR